MNDKSSIFDMFSHKTIKIQIKHVHALTGTLKYTRTITIVFILQHIHKGELRDYKEVIDIISKPFTTVMIS